MSNIYLIFRHVDYEGSELLAAYTNRRAAAEHCTAAERKNRESDIHFEMRVIEPKREYSPPTD